MVSQHQLSFVILYFILVSSISPACSYSDCETSEGKKGRCLVVNLCKEMNDLMLNMLFGQRSTENVTYFKSSLCGWQGRRPKVCCPLAEQQIHQNPPTFKIPNIRAPSSLLPLKCGLDDSTNRIIGGEEAELRQSRWMALIEYRHAYGFRSIACGGSLISHSFVVTAAHCVRGAILIDVGNPISVRLGEHDINNKGQDCVKVVGGKECADMPIVIPIKRFIAHPQYGGVVSGENDIALIRLKGRVEFTEFVQPICLPDSESATSDSKLYAAGWGLTSNGDGASRSAVKMIVKLPFVDLDACQAAYDQLNIGVNLTDSHLCAGGDEGRDTCTGDSGGPLMQLVGIRHYMVGVTSFGTKPCAIGMAAVYTKTFAHLDWIMSKLERDF